MAARQTPLNRRFLAAAILASSAVACGGRPGTAPPDSRQPIDVRTARAALADLPAPLDAGGVVRARTTATLVARIMAGILDVRVVPGDRVRAGQTLVVLDGRDLAAAARQARAAGTAADQGARAAAAERDAASAALALASASHDRIVSLFEKKSATAQERDDARAGLQTAEARLAGADARVRQAREALAGASAGGDAAGVTAGFATITAPFDGLITEKLVEPGNMAMPGMPLVRLEDTRGFRLEVQVDESRARYVTPGSRVPVLLDTTAGTPPREVLGEVTEVARAVDAGARSSLVKIDLPAVDGLRSGTFGRARFSGPARRTLVVPETALRRQGQVTSVFVVDGDRVRLRLVRVGEAADGRAEMIAGLDEGDLVVTNPQPGLADGQPVRPTSTARPAGDGGRR